MASDLTSNMIMDEISKVIQSNKILTLDNHMSFNSLLLRYLQGGGGSVKRLDNFLYKKKSIIRHRTFSQLLIKSFKKLYDLFGNNHLLLF
jgi:hypothetical protein